MYLRERFLRAPVGISGANFGIAETGTVVVVESEGNGRMCTTLPPVLITVMGIEKLLPRFQDLEVFLQLLPRSSTGERMNPYTSLWTGVTRRRRPARSSTSSCSTTGARTCSPTRSAGRRCACIRCSACLNVCPVYERTGGHAYGSVYPGPIGAILAPAARGLAGGTASLPYASSLCGACYEVCPVKIDIPRILVHLRARVVREETPRLAPERLALQRLAAIFGDRRRYERAQRLARSGALPAALAATAARAAARVGRRRATCRACPAQTFRQWWREEHE